MARASAGSRAQSRTATPLRPNWTASAVPQLPAPIIAAAPTLDVMLEMSSGRYHAAAARFVGAGPLLGSWKDLQVCWTRAVITSMDRQPQYRRRLDPSELDVSAFDYEGTADTGGGWYDALVVKVNP